MRRVKVKLTPAKASHNGWTKFLLQTKVGDAWEIPGTFGKKKSYIDSRRSNIRYIANRAGIEITTWLTPTGLWAKRIG